jgi:hypothetical protein
MNPFSPPPLPVAGRVPPPPPPQPVPLQPASAREYLCPRCLSVSAFTEVTTPDGEKYWHCTGPDCREHRQTGAEANIPYRYTERYDHFPPVPFCLIGGSGQGKTRFLVSLFDTLHQAASRWPEFYPDPLDTLQFDMLQQKLQDYLAGQEEVGSTFADIPEPMVIRYSGIPRVGGCQVIFFDNAGEAFNESSATFRRTSGFLRRAPSVVWTVSLRERDAADPDRITDLRVYDLERVLNNYTTAMATLGGDPRTHTLVVTLTKGERLVNLPGFPDSARQLLDADDLLNAAADPWAKLERVSDDLLRWLTTTRYNGLLNRLRATFRTVRVCVVSAQGREFDPNEPPRNFEPKAVLAPLFWLWRTDRPTVTVERHGETAVFLSAAEAFAAVKPNSTVRLGPGVHLLPAPVKLPVPISVLGDSPEQTFLVGSGTRPGEEFVLGVGSNGEVRLSNLTIERRGDVSGDVVRVMAGRVVAERVRFRGGREADEKSPIGCGLMIGRGAGGLLRHCTFQDNARTGLWVFTAGAEPVELAECTGRNNRTGLYVTQAGKVVADGCKWDGNRYGVRVADQGRCVARGGGAANNRKDGVEVSGDGHVTLAEFVATGNTRNGLEFAKAAGGTVSGGKYTTNATGIHIGGQSKVTVERAEVSDNREDGVVFADQSEGALTGGTVAGNGGYGFSLLGTVTADCKDVRTAGNKSGGWRVAKTVPKLTRVANCGAGRDDRPKGIFG